MSEGPRIVRLAEALAPLPLPATAKWPEGTWYETLVDRPGIQILVFAPRGKDHQTPHNRDEAYVVVRGTATLEMDGKSGPVASGDMIFVPRLTEHRFVDISDDFVAWVIFAG